METCNSVRPPEFVWSGNHAKLRWIEMRRRMSVPPRLRPICRNGKRVCQHEEYLGDRQLCREIETKFDIISFGMELLNSKKRNRDQTRFPFRNKCEKKHP